jgi:alpha-L-fucosidase
LPSAIQLAYQRTEMTAYTHFGLNTFDGTEYGDSAKDVPSLFNPTNLDVSEWVSELKNAGFQQATLVARHHTGFCLWPSAYTDYSVKNSPWKNGQGDLVREFVDAVRAARMRVGLWLSPWDQHYPSSSPDYETYFRHLLTELLTNYGPIYEILWDGYGAPTSLDWKGIVMLAKQLQPTVLVWTGGQIAATGADLRYLGSQSGQATRTTSNVADVPNGGPSNVWYPAEAPVSVLSTWFWHPDSTIISLKALQTVYFTTVGMNTTLILNVPPSTTGQFDTPETNLLGAFGTWYASLYKTNLVRGQPISADSTWENTGFDAAKVVDDDVCTYWAAASGKTSARLEVTPSSAITFKVISIREPIELGERTTSYHVELRQNGSWNKAPVDASGNQVQGTLIGQRQLWQLNATTADAIALVIDSAKDSPAIAEFGVYWY